MRSTNMKSSLLLTACALFCLEASSVLAFPRASSSSSSMSSSSSSSSSSRAPSKRGLVACPPVVAYKDTAQLVTTKTARSKAAPVLCFRDEKSAKARGFKVQKELQKKNITGWYRVKLNKKIDDCKSTGLGNGPALFVQINQKKTGVWADFCPSVGRLVGVSRDGGINVTQTEVSRFGLNPLNCTDGIVEVTQSFEMVPVVDGVGAYSARYTTVQRCPNVEESDRTCTSDFRGIVFPETHPLWPAVDPRVEMMGKLCSKALTTCEECHDELKGVFPPAE